MDEAPAVLASLEPSNDGYIDGWEQRAEKRDAGLVVGDTGRVFSEVW